MRFFYVCLTLPSLLVAAPEVDTFFGEGSQRELHGSYKTNSGIYNVDNGMYNTQTEEFSEHREQILEDEREEALEREMQYFDEEFGY